MKILDSANPWVTLSSVGAVVKVLYNPQGEAVPAAHAAVPVGSVPAHAVVSNPDNLLYVAEPTYKNITIVAMVATETLTIMGVIFTCSVGAPGNSQEFQVGGTDTITATNLVVAVNAYFKGIAARSFYFQPGGDDGTAGYPSFEARAVTTGAGTCTVVIEGSNDGVNFDATALLTLALTTSSTITSKVGAPTVRCAFYRARVTVLTGTAPIFSVYMMS